MPAAKKSQPQKAESSSSGVWMWVYVIGLIVAGLVSAFKFTAADPYLGWLLLLAAILSGIFFLDSEDIVNFGIRFLLFAAVTAGFKALVFGSFDLGSYLTGFFMGVLGFLTPAALTLLIVYFWKKYFGSMM